MTKPTTTKTRNRKPATNGKRRPDRYGDRIRLAVEEIKRQFADALNRVAYRKQRIVVQRRGRDWAAIIPLEDLELLEEVEDRLDVQTAQASLREATAKGEKPIPWEKIKKDLGCKG